MGIFPVITTLKIMLDATECMLAVGQALCTYVTIIFTHVCRPHHRSRSEDAEGWFSTSTLLRFSCYFWHAAYFRPAGLTSLWQRPLSPHSISAWDTGIMNTCTSCGLVYFSSGEWTNSIIWAISLVIFFFSFEVLKKHQLALSGAAVGQKRHAKQPAEGDWIMVWGGGAGTLQSCSFRYRKPNIWASFSALYDYI